MAIKKNPWSKFNETVKRPQTAGAVHVQDFYYDASAGLLAADIVDLGVLIGGAKIVDAMFWTEGDFGDIDATIGVLSGTLGSLLADDGVSARVLGTEFFNAAAIDTAETSVVRMAADAGFNVAPAVQDRSIGLQVSANVAAGAGKKFWLRIFYAQ